jgi:DNA-binding transcriptional regulator WhiA
MISSTKAEILGLICSDGNYRKYKTTFKEFDKRRNKTYIRHQRKRIIEFANTDKYLLKHFIELLKNEYDYGPNITISNKNVFRVCITKNFVIDDLLKDAKFGTLNWIVPNDVLFSVKKVQSAFLRGFFDGDGSVDFADKKIPRIRITSQNLNGLMQLKKILNNLEINANINGPYKYVTRNSIYELLLETRSVIRFIKLIKSNHSKKRLRFKKIAEGS